MARKQSLIEELILSHWWISLLLAGIIYLASNMLPEPTMPDMGRAVALSMFRGLAFAAPYFLAPYGVITLIRTLLGRASRSQAK